MDKARKILNAIIEWFLVLLMVAVIGVVLLQIIFRFFVSKPLTWSEELSRYLFIWISYIGGYLCSRNGSHMGIDYFVDRIPGIVGKIVKALAKLTLLAYMGVVCYYGFILSDRVMMQVSPAMHLPMGYVYMAIPLGMLLMLITSIVNIFEKPKKEGEK